VQVARVAQVFWKLAYHLHPHESLGKHGVLDRVFAELQQQQIIRVQVEAVSLDSSAVKVHPDGTGALKKTGRKPLGNHGQDGPPRFIWLPQMLERR
jgi:hypothetical protein